MLRSNIHDYHLYLFETINQTSISCLFRGLLISFPFPFLSFIKTQTANGYELSRILIRLANMLMSPENTKDSMTPSLAPPPHPFALHVSKMKAISLAMLDHLA